MREVKFLAHHSLFFVLVGLFLVVAAIDIFNIDRVFYKGICMLFAPITNSPCADFYDLPIWQVYLSMAILAALYHVHYEMKIFNKRLSSKK